VRKRIHPKEDSKDIVSQRALVATTRQPTLRSRQPFCVRSSWYDRRPRQLSWRQSTIEGVGALAGLGHGELCDDREAFEFGEAFSLQLGGSLAL